MIASCVGISAKASARAEAAQAVQVLDQPEDPAVVEPQALPDRVAALHRAVERADAGLVAVHELAVDVDEQVAVALVEGLEHQVILA